MNKIILSSGDTVLVDACDFAYLSQWKWHKSSSGYAQRTKGKNDIGFSRNIKMHQQIFGSTDRKVEVDRINRDKLDNRKKNLRFCTKSQNNANRLLQSNSSSGHKGVSWCWRKCRWRAQIKTERALHLGYFKIKEQAAQAYNKAAKKYFGDFACLNAI